MQCVRNAVDVFVKAKTEPRWKWSVRSAENLLPLSSKKMIYADPISDRFYEERKAIEKALHGELAPSEEAKLFIKPLLENYHKRFPLDLLYEHYGWDNDSVYTALAENISDPVLKDFDMPIEKVGSAPDYAELVRDSARKEFETFKGNVMSKSAEDIFYHNYEIHVKTELMETIESYDFDEEYFRALYEEVGHGGIYLYQ